MANTDTQITIRGIAELIDQHKLEAFVDQRYHWKSLSTNDQMKMARELLELRAFLSTFKDGAK